MLTLYYAPGACSFVPHVALEQIQERCGERFETVMINLRQGEHQTPEYLALNPRAQVPVIKVDGQPLSQLLAICDYLDRRFPPAGLLPSEPWARAQAMSTLAWMNSTVHPTFGQVYRAERHVHDEAAKAELRKAGTERFRTCLHEIEREVEQARAKGHPFLLGQGLSFLDAYALTFLRWGGYIGIDPNGLPRYKAYVERLAQHPPVARAIAREGIALHTYRAA